MADLESLLELLNMILRDAEVLHPGLDIGVFHAKPAVRPEEDTCGDVTLGVTLVRDDPLLDFGVVATTGVGGAVQSTSGEVTIVMMFRALPGVGLVR